MRPEDQYPLLIETIKLPSSIKLPWRIRLMLWAHRRRMKKMPLEQRKLLHMLERDLDQRLLFGDEWPDDTPLIL